MPYIHKIHLADRRVVTSSQDYTRAICRTVVAFRNTTEDLDRFWMSSIPKEEGCKNCAGVIVAAIRRLDARDRLYGR